MTPSSPASFADNITNLLLPSITDTDPLYILLKRHDTVPKLVAVSYVPDTAKVRQKMLFASTRLTLVRELGREHFRETIFTTTKDELTPDGFLKHDKHEQLEAPLTEEERSLQGVKNAEAEEGSRGTGTREIHLSQTMNMPVQEDALAALKDLSTEGKNLVMLVSFVQPNQIKNPSVTINDGILTVHVYRKLTPIPRRSSLSPIPRLLPPYPSLCRPFPRPSLALPSSALHTSTAATNPRPCSSSTRARCQAAEKLSRTACFTP